MVDCGGLVVREMRGDLSCTAEYCSVLKLRRVRFGCSRFWAFFEVLVGIQKRKPSKCTTCVVLMYFSKVQKCTVSGLIVVLLGGFVVLVGSKVVLVVGFCGTFRGFSGNVVVLVG